MRRLRFMITTSCALALAACVQGTSTDEPFVDEVGQALVNPASVLGFESIADWTASGAVKSASADHSEGTSALALRNFNFVELQSVPLTTVSGVTSTIAFDLKPPVSPGFGNAQLVVNIPSQGVHSVWLGQVNLAGLPAGTYSPISFSLPASVVSALSNTYSDLTFKIVLNVPQTTTDYLVDNLRFVGGAPAGHSKVELRVSSADDRLVLYVNGLQRRMFHSADPSIGQRIDVSDWFGSGDNDLRIQTLNTEGPTSYGVEVWVDNQRVVNATCPATLCNGQEVRQGIVADRTFSVDTPNRPALQPVTVTATSSQPGKVYVNDVYTGRATPTTLSLPPGNYTIGVGLGTQSPPYDYTGSYREQSVTVGASPMTVDVTANPPLGIQEDTRIGILPIRRSINYRASLGGADPSNVGVLSEGDIERLLTQARATSARWLEPLSYGLAKWTVDVLPTVEDVPIYEPNHDGWDTGRFQSENPTAHLLSDYDMIVLYIPQHRADGSLVHDESNLAWAWDDRYLAIPTTYTGEGIGVPNAGLLHEVIHNYEGYNRNVLRSYNGIHGLHGSSNHGYYDGSNGEHNFVYFYRHFLRGQVAEFEAMRPDQDWPSIGATSGSLYLGVFPVLRHGFNVR
ncbi:PEGA domain-containing protein [Sorangium sp. So ce834]|uniref:PEGA domain-containing protein n=1 Tax=Sorangium sp. So ce834 TaxID=3133321 RepID=UPI003F6332A6